MLSPIQNSSVVVPAAALPSPQEVYADIDQMRWARKLGEKDYKAEHYHEMNTFIFYLRHKGQIYRFIVDGFDIPQDEAVLKSIKEEATKLVDYQRLDTTLTSPKAVIKIVFSLSLLEKVCVHPNALRRVKDYLDLTDADGQRACVDYLRKAGHTKLLEELFVDRPDYALRSYLAPQMDYTDLEVAREMLFHSVEEDNTQWIPGILKAHPSLGAGEPFYDALTVGSWKVAEALFPVLLEQGLRSKSYKYFNLMNKILESSNELPIPTQQFIVHVVKEHLKRNIEIIRSDTEIDGKPVINFKFEQYYRNKGPNERLLKQLVFLFAEHGERLTAPMVEEMLMRIKKFKEPKDHLFIPILIAQGFVTQAHIDYLLSPEKGKSEAVLASEALEKVRWLEQKIRVNNLNADRIPMEEIKKIWQLKKEIKNYLTAHPKEDTTQLQKNFALLKDTYRKLVKKHIFLAEIKAIRQDMLAYQAGANPTPRLIRFYALFSDLDGQSRNYDRISSDELKVFRSPEWKVYWQKLKECALIAAMKSQNHELRSRKIVWLHGTHSSALPLLVHLGGLIPMGQLLEKAAPPCGALVGSENALNKEHLSGEILTDSWEEVVTFGGWATRLLINYGYATNASTFEPEKSAANLTEASLNRAMDVGVDTKLFSTLRIDIIRLRMIDEKHPDLKTFAKSVQEKLDKAENPDEREVLQRLAKALTMDIAYHYTADDIAMIRGEKKPVFPIIFASQTKEVESVGHERTQFLVKNKAAFGEDLQIAFTSADRVDELQAILVPFGMKVYSLETAFYLEMLSMAKGSQAKGKLEPEVQLRQTLHREILSKYALPFPANPSYRNEDGAIVRMDQDPSDYRVYLDEVESGARLPRDLHGPSHAARVAIYALAIAKFTGSKGKRDDLSIAMTAAFHDAEREGDGVDHWDSASADALEKYMLERGASKAEAAEHAFAIREKDPKSKVYTSDLQATVHDSDTFEITRVLKSKEDFRKDELTIYKPGDPTIEALISECHHFTKITEEEVFKRNLEQTSDDIIGDLLIHIHKIHAAQNCFPTLTRLLHNHIHSALVSQAAPAQKLSYSAAA